MSREAEADLDGRRILVVGGAGFVGSNLVRRALDLGCADVTVVDNLLSAERSNLPGDPRVELVEGSIADDRVLDQLVDEFEFVFHLATFHGNQNSIADPLADHANNLLTTLKFFDRLKDYRVVEKIVYSASGCTLAPHTYGAAEPTAEDGPVPFELDSPYQISKVVGEFYAVYYHKQYRLPTVRARFQNVYGPGEVLGAGQWRGTPATIWRNVVPTFIYRALKHIPLELDNAGQASRDFIFVEDIVEGLLRCATRGAAGDVYNLASGRETTIATLAQLINELTANPVPVVSRPARDWDRSGHRLGSTDKARRALGFEARVSLEPGLRQTIAWTEANLERIELCIQRHAEHVRPAELARAG